MEASKFYEFNYDIKTSINFFESIKTNMKSEWKVNIFLIIFKIFNFNYYSKRSIWNIFLCLSETNKYLKVR